MPIYLGRSECWYFYSFHFILPWQHKDSVIASVATHNSLGTDWRCKCLFQDIPYYLWRGVVLAVETSYLVVTVFFCNDSSKSWISFNKNCSLIRAPFSAFRVFGYSVIPCLGNSAIPYIPSFRRSTEKGHIQEMLLLPLSLLCHLSIQKILTKDLERFVNNNKARTQQRELRPLFSVRSGWVH